jgi:hypothetical protein
MNRRYLMKLIADYKEASIRQSWAGSQHPSERYDIQDYYKEARRKLFNYIIKNTRPY